MIARATALLAVTALAACSRRDAVDAAAFRRPDCHVARAAEAEDTTDGGRLRMAWRRTIERHMAPYDEVMSGARPAYEAFVRVDGSSYGPLRGIVRDDVIDGRMVRSLGLDGPTNTRITIQPSTPRQPGAFLIQIPSAVIECADCIDRDAGELRLASNMRFEPRSNVSVELRRLRPAEIDIVRAEALFPWLEGARVDGSDLVVMPHDDVYVPVQRPPRIDERYRSCELTSSESPQLRIATGCPSVWRVQFASKETRTRCCTRPRHHGPPMSGYYPEDCVDAD